MGIPQGPRDLACLRVRIPAPADGRSPRPTAPASRRDGPGLGRPDSLARLPNAPLACDFFSASLPGRTQAYALAVIKHAARRLRIPASGCPLPGNGSASGPGT